MNMRKTALFVRGQETRRLLPLPSRVTRLYQFVNMLRREIGDPQPWEA